MFRWLKIIGIMLLGIIVLWTLNEPASHALHVSNVGHESLFEGTFIPNKKKFKSKWIKGKRYHKIIWIKSGDTRNYNKDANKARNLYINSIKNSKEYKIIKPRPKTNSVHPGTRDWWTITKAPIYMIKK